jgi:serine/threonine protein kinase
MSFNFDATGIGQLAIKLGLVTEEQFRECLLELGDPKAPGAEMLRLLERKRYLTPWQSGKLLKGDMEGYFLGGYRLLYKIASGSFGRVYRGDDPRSGQVVAIKVLRNKWTVDKQKVELFMREGKLGLTIRHPNIVSVLAVNQDSVTKQFFIVMEFIEGGNLRDLLQIRKPLGTDEALRIMEECAQGLAYSHARGLTHRDIKPTNILIVAATMQAKLVDFGLAEISAGSSVFLQRQEDRDEDVAVDRTVDYAGLEKATGQKPGDVRSDIYFLGSVLYECLTGHPLMTVTKDRQVRMQARRYQEVEETLHNTASAYGLKPALVALLAKMVAYEPGVRYQTPTQLVEAIQACRVELQERERSAHPRMAGGQKTVFVLESSEKLKEHMRERFKEEGFRVLMSSDPDQPLKRYQYQPYHALIINAGSIGKEAVGVYNRVLKESDLAKLDLAAVLILDRKQADMANDAISHKRGSVMYLPLKMKNLIDKIEELTPNINSKVEGEHEAAD